MRRAVSLTVLAAAMLAAAPLQAKPGKPPRVRTEFAGALTGTPGERLTAMIVTYPPGGRSVPHRHDAFVFVQVLSGTVVSQVAGHASHTYHAGAHWVETPGAHHLVCRNPSTRRKARLLVIFVARNGALLDVPDPAAPRRAAARSSR